MEVEIDFYASPSFMVLSFYCLRRNELTDFESYYSYRYFSSSQVVRGSYLNTYL